MNVCDIQTHGYPKRYGKKEQRNRINMSVYFIADPHLNHYNIALHTQRIPWLYPNPNYDPNKRYHFKYNNPWAVNIKTHNEALIENWNSWAQKGDLIYVVGDFAWKDHNHFLMALNGKKILVLGNHDKASREVYKNFTEVHEFGCRRKINGHDISISHYALRTWASSYHGSWSLYGHSHGRLPEFDNMLSFDVGVDVWGYGLVPFEVIEKKMQMKIDWMAQNGKYSVDGEERASGSYDRSPDKRVVDTRLKNKAIMKAMGYPINDAMWPETILDMKSNESHEDFSEEK